MFHLYFYYLFPRIQPTKIQLFNVMLLTKWLFVCFNLFLPEYTTTIKYYFPEEHNLRKKIEKKQRQKQHPLPGSQVPAGARRQRGRRGANQQLSVFAGVCFVVMLIFLGFTIFAITIGFVSWYLLEVAMDLVSLCGIAEGSLKPGPSFTKAFYLLSRLLNASSLLRLYCLFH